jgi:hypothetical protein
MFSFTVCLRGWFPAMWFLLLLLSGLLGVQWKLNHSIVAREQLATTLHFLNFLRNMLFYFRFFSSKWGKSHAPTMGGEFPDYGSKTILPFLTFEGCSKMELYFNKKSYHLGGHACGDGTSLLTLCSLCGNTLETTYSKIWSLIHNSKHTMKVLHFI